MLATLEQLKAALGIEDNTKDALLTSCLVQANGLIAGYIGADLSDVATDRPFDALVPEGATFVHFPVWPLISITTFKVNDVDVVEGTDYTLNKRQAAAFFDSLPGNSTSAGNKIEATFKAGLAVVPDDLNTICLNLASTAYNNGGQLVQQSSGSNELKSLTMFDAMSMSFDTGSSVVSTPEGLVKTWSFILDKYRVEGGFKQPVVK